MKATHEEKIRELCKAGERLDPKFKEAVLARLDGKAAKEFARVVGLDVKRAA